MARDPFSDADIASLLDPKGRLRVTRATYAHLAREAGSHKSYTTQVFMLLRRIGIPVVALLLGFYLLVAGFFTDFSLALAFLWAIPLFIIGYWLLRTTISDIADLLRRANRVVDPSLNPDGTFDPFNPPQPRRSASGPEWDTPTFHQNLGPDGGPRFRRGIALPRAQDPNPEATAPDATVPDPKDPSSAPRTEEQ